MACLPRIGITLTIWRRSARPLSIGTPDSGSSAIVATSQTAEQKQNDNDNQKQAQRSRSVIKALHKCCWRVWLGGLLLSATCFAQSLGSVGVGYNDLLTEGTTGHWTSSHGWYVLPTLNINKQVGVFADFTNFYSKGQNIHGETFGLFHAFSNETRYTPFVFVGIGHIRASNAGTTTNSFDWAAGGGLMIRLTRWISLQAIPVEYVMNTANGKSGNNFLARVGIALTIPK